MRQQTKNRTQTTVQGGLVQWGLVQQFVVQFGSLELDLAITIYQHAEELRKWLLQCLSQCDCLVYVRMRQAQYGVEVSDLLSI